MKGKTIFLSTALAGVLAAASAAHAGDVKIHSGSDCKATRDNLAGDASRVSSSVTTENVSTGTVTVECPIERDNHKNTNGLKSLIVRVQSDGINTLNCVVAALSPLGTVVAFGQNSTTSNAVTALPLAISFSIKNGTYVMQCTLPPGTEVINYRVAEFEL